ncbi:serine hydrolase domain-containing protein [Intrasporangium sp. DVR]|uniref:serine hydrolase domain-containing protein n=1 Tax=Intrasporangium sp. DVR TaxID=3127867 RepID=UPI00313A5BA0
MILPRSSPRQEGVDARGLVDFLDTVQQRRIELHSVMVARHGRVVAEGWWQPYAAGRAHLVYSVSKSLTATAIGLLVDDGVLSLDDPVLAHLPGIERETLHPHWSQVTVRHCLTMTVGHEADAWDPAFAGLGGDVLRPGTDWLPIVLGTVPEHIPGSTFTYNQVATYLLSRVARAASGRGLVAILRPRLLDPLGIPELPWQRDPLGHELGFTGAHLTTEGLLAFSQLHLDRGEWRGQQLLPAAWVDEASAPFGPRHRDPAANDDSVLGYGYSFWTSRHGYRADGAFGQLGLVLPDEDAAVAITAEHGAMQEILDAFWETAHPALGRPGTAQADAVLSERLAALAFPARSGVDRGPDDADVGRSGADHSAPAATGDRSLSGAYTGVSVRRGRRGHLMRLRRRDSVLELQVGDGEWLESELRLGALRLPVVASGGWVDGDTFEAEVFVVETPHRFRVTARLRAGEATLAWRERPLPGSDPFALAVGPPPLRPVH